MSFEKALQFTLKWEGGFSNDPSDSGGATQKGITQAVYNTHRKGLPFTPVKNITDEEVTAIYLKDYWIESNCNEMPKELALAVFDTAVNCGVKRAIKILQVCLGLEGKPDGIYGKNTRQAVIGIRDLKDFVSKYLNERSSYYQRLAEIYPGKGKFLKGWLNRVEDQRKFIFT